MTEIEIVKPSLSELEMVVRVEQAAWPDIGTGMVAEYEKFKTRIELGMMYLLYFKGKPAGIISFQYAAFTNAVVLENIFEKYEQKQKNGKGLMCWEEIVENYKLPKDWYEATNNGYIVTSNGLTNGLMNETYKETTHDPKGDCVFLISVGVDAKLKGQGFVNHLIGHTITEAKKQGKTFALGYGRLPQLGEKFKAATLIEAQGHLLELNDKQLPRDYGARFHVFNGAKAVAVIPKAMDDPESLNYGFLALYKL